MTVQEMHYDFQIKASQVDSLQDQEFLPAERDWLLNEAQLQVIRSRINKNNPRGVGLEEDQKRKEDLQAILVKYPEQPGLPLVYHSAEHVYELPFQDLVQPYYHFARAQVIVNCGGKYSNKVSVRIRQHGTLNRALNDSYLASDQDKVVGAPGRSSNGQGSSLYLYPDVSHTLGSIFIEYWKNPVRINLGGYPYIDGVTYPTTDCELSEHLHPEIVNEAVKLALGLNKDQFGYQVADQQVQRQE